MIDYLGLLYRFGIASLRDDTPTQWDATSDQSENCVEESFDFFGGCKVNGYDGIMDVSAARRQLPRECPLQQLEVWSTSFVNSAKQDLQPQGWSASPHMLYPSQCR